ncbi:hypothetical protein GYB22_09200 [bacterium]|nr:hypothetical protein [bacterium]
MKFINILFLSFLSLACIQNSTAQSFDEYLSYQCTHATHNTLDPRADTFDVLKYLIVADFTPYPTAYSFSALTTLEIKLLEDASVLSLDLLGLPVDSVTVNGVKKNHTYSSPSLNIPLDNAKKDDVIEVVVAYKGNPQKDPTWGGFYFTKEYAFNMGVGFASNPHNFGRVWFPCLDNFTDKALYEFKVTVNDPLKAYCNGLLQSVTDHQNGTHTFHWKLDQPIATYLASVAISDYEELRYNVDGIPVKIAAAASDTANVRSSFENLPLCIQSFVASYGTHRFDRIGYCLVPFNSGAMEHATNIAYPINAVANGSKDQERLYAHELAHHWWGDNTTCETQEDMWLNEGWANYSEYLFAEAVYGKEEYLKRIKANHLNVLQFAHTPLRDGEALPVSGIGHAHTYGMHVYQKGGDMVHTLRGIMGDDAFFDACEDFQEQFKFQNVSTEDLKKVFETHTSYDLDPFFDQWIKTRGFCHNYIFSADGSKGQYSVRIKQDQRFNEIEYQGIPYTLRAYADDFRFYDTVIVVGGNDNTYNVNVPFAPSFWVLDPEERISDAVTENMMEIESSGTYNLGDAFGEIEVHSLDTDALVRLEHHWVQPDHYYMDIPNLALHTQRYWTFDGLWTNGFNADLILEYNGLANVYLDNELIRITEDSLVLMYRPNAWSLWQIADNYTKNMGSKFDRRGSITVENAAKGQYALAMYDQDLINGINNLENGLTFDLLPNPASDFIEITFDIKPGPFLLEITDRFGRVVFAQQFIGNERKYRVDLTAVGSGVYYVGLSQDLNSYEPKRLVVK